MVVLASLARQGAVATTTLAHQGRVWMALLGFTVTPALVVSHIFAVYPELSAVLAEHGATQVGLLTILEALLALL